MLSYLLVFSLILVIIINYQCIFAIYYGKLTQNDIIIMNISIFTNNFNYSPNNSRVQCIKFSLLRLSTVKYIPNISKLSDRWFVVLDRYYCISTYPMPIQLGPESECSIFVQQSLRAN